MPKPMPKLALVTCEEFPDLHEDEQLVLPALAQRGVQACPIPWTDGLETLAACDAVVVRSCWDYHLAPEKFARWIDALEGLDVPVWNPPHVLRWNLDKRHLLELEAAGFPVLPTRVVDKGGEVSLHALLEELEWDEAVVKPVISLGGWETFRVRQHAPGPERAGQEQRWATVHAGHDMLVQCFASEIATEGELSLLFFAGAFSHAVIKHPGQGEFRVHEEFGGSKLRIDPPLELVEFAAQVLHTCPGPQVYARVDGVQRNGRFELMEVELLDPSLYLEDAPDAVERWADRLAALVSP